MGEYDEILAAILRELLYLVDRATPADIEHLWACRDNLEHALEQGDIRILGAFNRFLKGW